MTQDGNQNMDCGRSRKIFWAVAAAIIAAESEAHAYSDPGSGALLWQALLAGFFSLLFYIRRIKTWIQSGRKDKDKVE